MTDLSISLLEDRFKSLKTSVSSQVTRQVEYNLIETMRENGQCARRSH